MLGPNKTTGKRRLASSFTNSLYEKRGMLVLLQYLNLMRFDRNRDMVHKVVRALVAQIPIPKNQYRKFETNIFPEKELRGHSPNFHIHVSVSELYIATVGLPILLQEICKPILGIQYINRS